ncbi:Gfo/Idh/MocA family protein [Georgenia subflava]|uniref:Gfo/Idh/MocA family protein n=1 Tax=Georgenia subflava TaxID=1622177 RepID=UPI0022201CFD|nr:Gfo/Idh/MocA family oxidoreductase [Georgenia subflava]
MKELRVGLVGAGTIAGAHLPAWHALGAQVSAFSLEGAAELTDRHGGSVVTSFEELMERCDVIDVCTPTPVHRHYAEAALLAGRDVVAEKPLARTGDDAVLLARVAAETGRHLYPAHVVRFFPAYATMAEAVRAGRIGRPAVLRLTRTSAFPMWREWFADPAQSGGVVMDLMIHDLDIARWVAGDVTDVYATLAQGEEDGLPIAMAHAVLTHAGGAISHVRGVWGAPSTTFSTSFHVAGDGGVLTYDSRDARALTLDVGTGSGGGRLPDISLGESPYLTQLREFAGAIAGGPVPRVSAADGVAAVELALAALTSIETGDSVRLPAAGGGAR